MDKIIWLFLIVLYIWIIGYCFYKLILPKIRNKTKNNVLLFFSFYYSGLIILLNIICWLSSKISLNEHIEFIIAVLGMITLTFVAICIPFFVIIWVYNILKWLRSNR